MSARRVSHRLLLIGLVTIALNGCGGRSHPAHVNPATDRLFAPTSVWNTPLPDNAPLDPRSPQLVRWLLVHIEQELHSGPSPAIQTDTYSTPIYRVPADEPPAHVTLDNTSPWAQSLARALQAVPIPPSARPAVGTDAQLTIWQPSTDRLWELWRARRTPDGWHAAWGGAIAGVSRSPGYYTADSWPGSQPYWGATATSLPVAAGVMRIDELERGTIDHALAVALPLVRSGEYAWPAERSDGNDPDPDAIPEGARLRLDPRVDLSRLDLPPVIRMMAIAAQRYGMIVRDRTGEAFAFYAEAPTAGDPYPRIFGGQQPYNLLKYFPWQDIEVLRMDIRRGTGAPS